LSNRLQLRGNIIPTKYYTPRTYTVKTAYVKRHSRSRRHYRTPGKCS